MLLANNDAPPTLENATLTANCFGLSAMTKDGAPASLAIVDENGLVLESGERVSKAAWHLMLKARTNFLKGEGHLRVVL